VVPGAFGQGKWAPQDLPRAQGVSTKAVSALSQCSMVAAELAPADSGKQER